MCFLSLSPTCHFGNFFFSSLCNNSCGKMKTKLVGRVSIRCNTSLHVSSGKMSTGMFRKTESLGKTHLFATGLSKSNFSSGRVSTWRIFLPTKFAGESLFPKVLVDFFKEGGFLCNRLLHSCSIGTSQGNDLLPTLTCVILW